MKQRARAAVVGCGVISTEHFRVLAKHPRIELVGVCDRSPAAVRWTAERYATKPFTDHAEMLASEQPDVVHVLTPPSSHRAIAEDALRAGAHVIVEKPIASSLAELNEMLSIADRCGRYLVESHNYRFNDQILAIDDLVTRGVLGDVVAVDLLLALDLRASKFAMADGNPTAHLPGGAVRDFLTHLCYLGMHYFGDAPIGAVEARWQNRSGNPYIGADDFEARVELGEGVAHQRFDARIVPDCFRLWVRGTAGSARPISISPSCASRRVGVPSSCRRSSITWSTAARSRSPGHATCATRCCNSRHTTGYGDFSNGFTRRSWTTRRRR